jgi:hypothetical protein
MEEIYTDFVAKVVMLPKELSILIYLFIFINKNYSSLVVE